MVAISLAAGAKGADLATPTDAPDATPAPAAPFGVLSGAWDSANFLGDLGGLRSTLGKAGITLGVTENAEMFGNATGGAQQGFSGNGLTTVTLQLDTKPAFGLDGGLFNVSGLHIWGGNLTETNLLALQTLTGIEADHGVRLWELWYQQKFGDKFDVKVGEQSIDQEFMTSVSAGFFLNSAMGWGALPALNLPGGGPAYPLAALGVRGRYQVSDAVTVLGGVYSGSPLPWGSDGSQESNPYGVKFPVNGVLAIAELQYTINGGVGGDKPDANGPLPGTYKLGGWYDSLPFDDQQFDQFGVPLASPASNGVPATHNGDYSIYAIADQTIYRTKDGVRNVTAFIRPMFTTMQDRNLVSFSVNGGLTVHQPFEGRANDVLGLGFGVVQVSSGAANADQDMQIYQPDVFTPVRTSETFLEATYQAQVLPSVVVQPDIQYIMNPAPGSQTRTTRPRRSTTNLSSASGRTSRSEGRPSSGRQPRRRAKRVRLELAVALRLEPLVARGLQFGPRRFQIGAELGAREQSGGCRCAQQATLLHVARPMRVADQSTVAERAVAREDLCRAVRRDRGENHGPGGANRGMSGRVRTAGAHGFFRERGACWLAVEHERPGMLVFVFRGAVAAPASASIRCSRLNSVGVSSAVIGAPTAHENAPAALGKVRSASRAASLNRSVPCIVSASFATC